MIDPYDPEKTSSNTCSGNKLSRDDFAIRYMAMSYCRNCMAYKCYNPEACIFR